MNVRKLAELIAKIKRSMWGKSGLSSELARNMYLAENLIANGVTFVKDNNVPSKWISVKDRLPEANVAVLVYDGKNVDGFTFYDLSYVSKYGVTHWMPLPQPPKGE